MSGYVRARIDDGLKEDASAVLDSIGLTVSDVVRMLLTRIAKEKALPVDLVIPNAKTIAAMEAGRVVLDNNVKRFETAEEMFDALDPKARRTRKAKSAASV